MPGLGFQSLEELRAHIGDCSRCSLGETRSTLVFGAGDPNARVMLIGEAPGRNEDLRGEPFVGAAGKLLDELLAHAGLGRDEVYIANVLKCRPPGNRDPLPQEIEMCAPFLEEQMRIINPDIVVTLGNFATRFVLKTDEGITQLRGRLLKAGDFTVLPIFHPAAAIYDRTKRDALFADFELLGRLLQGGEGAEARGLAFLSESEPATQELGERLGPLLQPGDVLLLSGDLGAGKTQLTKGIARGLGIPDPVTSPTFNILLVHEGRLPLYHFDLYRLERPSELEDLDYFGTLEADGVSVVEWGDRFEQARPADSLTVALRIDGDETRRIEVHARGSRSEELARSWRRASKGIPGIAVAGDGS